jgi:hypothetical protein
VLLHLDGLPPGFVARRINPAGRSQGQFFAKEIARPLGEDFYIGLPASVDRNCWPCRVRVWFRRPKRGPAPPDSADFLFGPPSVSAGALTGGPAWWHSSWRTVIASLEACANSGQ